MQFLQQLQQTEKSTMLTTTIWTPLLQYTDRRGIHCYMGGLSSTSSRLSEQLPLVFRCDNLKNLHEIMRVLHQSTQLAIVFTLFSYHDKTSKLSLFYLTLEVYTISRTLPKSCLDVFQLSKFLFTLHNSGVANSLFHIWIINNNDFCFFVIINLKTQLFTDST